MVNKRDGIIRFLKWAKKYYPKLYGGILVSNPQLREALKNNLGYMGAFDWNALTTGVTDTIQKLIPVYQQNRIMKTQLQLAQEGRPMMSPEQISQASTTGIQVKLSPEIEKEVVATTQTARTGMNWTVLAILGAGAFLVFGMRKKGRR